MKHKFCALLLTLAMAMSAGLFSACREEKDPSGDVNVTDPSGGTEQGGTQNKDPDEGTQKPGEGGESGPETPPAEEQATEGLHYTPLYGEDGTAIGYTVGAGEAADEEKIVIPAKHDGLPVLRIGMPEDFFEPHYEPNTNYLMGYNLTEKFLEEYSAYVEGIGYDPQKIEKDVELYEEVLISFYQQYSFAFSRAKTIEISNGVTQLGFNALAASDIESLYLPESVTKIENAFPNGLVSFCDKLTKIEVSEENPVYHSEGNCLIETATKTVVAGCKASVIPEGTLTIGSCAFASIGFGSLDGTETSDTEKFKEIKIPKSVTSIQDYAFFQCFELERIIYAGTVEEWNNIDKRQEDKQAGNPKGPGWRANTVIKEVVCTNGTLTGSDIG